MPKSRIFWIFWRKKGQRASEKEISKLRRKRCQKHSELKLRRKRCQNSGCKNYAENGAILPVPAHLHISENSRRNAISGFSSSSDLKNYAESGAILSRIWFFFRNKGRDCSLPDQISSGHHGNYAKNGAKIKNCSQNTWKWDSNRCIHLNRI